MSLPQFRQSQCYVQLTCHGSCVRKVSVVVGIPPLLFTMYIKKASRSLLLSMAFLMEFIALTKPCRRPSIPWFSEEKSKHSKFTKVLSTFATLEKIQYLRQVVFKMSVFMKVNFPRWNRNDLSKSFACDNFTPTHTILAASNSLKKKTAYWFRETGNCTFNDLHASDGRDTEALNCKPITNL
jgi:hypothetical protein